MHEKALPANSNHKKIKASVLKSIVKVIILSNSLLKLENQSSRPTVIQLPNHFQLSSTKTELLPRGHERWNDPSRPREFRRRRSHFPPKSKSTAAGQTPTPVLER
jgi:hypothetical protein